MTARMTRWGPLMVIAFAIVTALALASPTVVAAKSDGTPTYANVTLFLDDFEIGPQALQPAMTAFTHDAAAAYAQFQNPATPTGGPMARHVTITTTAQDFGEQAKTNIGAGMATINEGKTGNGAIAALTNV